MNRRLITLADGRYLIFYTFVDEGSEASPGERAEEKPAEPVAEAEAEEERGV
ncbi:MAG TPA: hypothetical protein VJS44_20755 [Pyrinomonadaceae bacterium]|nr:hypothetical protein [Pyrinomonadaceae bacterium]